MLILGMTLIPNWTVDDAYISYQYAQNFADGQGLVWHPDSDRVEGYTGHLLPLIASLFSQNTIEVWIDFINLNFLLINILCLVIIARQMGMRQGWELLPTLVLLAIPIVYMHLHSGLETNIFSSLISLWMMFILLATKQHWGMIIGGALSAILIILTRPEGIVFVFAALGIGLFLFQQRKVLFYWLLMSVTFTIFTILLRYRFYGDLLPNTYYAKQFPGINPESIKAFIQFVALYLALPMGFGWMVWLAGMKEKAARDAKGTFLVLFGLVSGGILLVGYGRSQLFMNYGDRMFYPLLGIGILVGCHWLHRGWHQLTPGSVQQRWIRRTLVVGGGVFLVIMAQKALSTRGYILNYRAVMEEEWKPAAEFLRTQLEPDDLVICYQDAGWIPYSLPNPCVDFGRLNDHFLAHEHPQPEEAADYFFSHNAKAVVMTSYDAEDYRYIEEAEHIQSDARFSRYQLVRIFSNRRGYPYHQWIYMRSEQ